ncbi:MAG TPA: hypothetical protein PKZ15_06085 [Paludibacteraceae bacterium]|nr:hypothetical protein [Paludibacteraceae bacterium]
MKHILFILSIFFCNTLFAEDPRCIYFDGKEKCEVIFKDTILPETYTRQFFVYKWSYSTGNQTLLLKRDSIYRINNAFVKELPRKRLNYPRVDTLDGKPYLFFFYERQPSNISVLHTEIVAVLYSLEDGKCYELSNKGSRRNVKLRKSAYATDFVFLNVSQSVKGTTDTTLINYMRRQVEKTGFIKELSDLNLDDIKNYVVLWNLKNNLEKIKRDSLIDFPYYKEPFSPLKAEMSGVRVLKNKKYEVIAFPFGDIVAFDRGKKLYFVVWALEELQKEDFASSMNWNGESDCEIKVHGYFDTSEFTINLKTGKITYLK